MTSGLAPAFLRTILPGHVASAQARPFAGDAAQLLPGELVLVESCPAGRTAEFATGRILARHLFDRFGRTGPVLRGDLGEPLWPAGLVGSIAHCADLVAVALASEKRCRGLGIDVEPCEPLPPELARMIMPGLGEYETGILDGLGGLSVFCAKEAVYKALFPRNRMMMDFDAVHIALADCRANFTAHLRIDLPDCPAGTLVRGRLCRTSRHLGAAVVLPAG